MTVVRSKALVFLLALVPAIYLVGAAAMDALGSNPAEALIRATGDWALRFLCLALAVTPLRVLTARPAVARFRRMIGLYCFFYAFLHALCYSGLDMGLDAGDIAADIGKRPFILAGFAAFCLLLLLAATSWNGAQRLLGGRRWQLLHRAVYIVAPLAIVHFLWMRAGKNNFSEVWLYGVILGALLAFRMHQFIRKKAREPGGILRSLL